MLFQSVVFICFYLFLSVFVCFHLFFFLLGADQETRRYDNAVRFHTATMSDGKTREVTVLYKTKPLQPRSSPSAAVRYCSGETPAPHRIYLRIPVNPKRLTGPR